LLPIGRAGDEAAKFAGMPAAFPMLFYPQLTDFKLFAMARFVLGTCQNVVAGELQCPQRSELVFRHSSAMVAAVRYRLSRHHRS
jgi:hypothetical protein